VWINVALAEMLQLPPNANASLTSPGAPDFTFKFCRNGEELSLEELPMRKAMALGRELRDIEFDLVRKDGVIINMFGHAIPLKDERGEVRGCIAAWADITARKLAEESLKSADRRKDQFLAMLAHELRNPLAPLRTGLELLQLGGIDPAESAEVLEMMHGQLMHIIRLVDDVLEVSRITRGRIELRTERLELRSVLQTALETTHALLTELNHTLTVELPPEPVYLEADPVRLTQIIANLLQNAAKYTERSGKLELIVCNPPPIDPHSVLDSEKPHFVEISVRDNGLGIAPEMLPHVFDLFEQAGASHSHARGGLGIGLMLTSKLVQLHGGSIRAESGGKGRGSLFTVLLPAASAPESPSADLLSVASPAPARPTRQRRILVVDDNRDAADCLGKILALLHHEVRVAHDGLAALEEIPRFHPELVLMDLGMPGLDGIETARRILAESSASPPVLVALSGWGQDEDRRKTREAGFAAHLLKPVELNVLQATISELLD
jgi:signal transduction histidine kinase